jgi:hypothetical protein
LRDFRPKRPYLVSKNLQMIHSNRISHLSVPAEEFMVPSKVLNLMAFVPAKDFQLSRRFYRDLGFHENWGSDSENAPGLRI